MAWASSTVDDQIAATIADGTWISLHSGDPGTTAATAAANELTGARQQTTWGTPGGGTPVSGSEVGIAVAAGEDPTHMGLWDAQTGGNFAGGYPLDSPPGAYTSAGTCYVTPVVSE